MMTMIMMVLLLLLLRPGQRSTAPLTPSGAVPAGAPVRLLSAAYVREVFTPQYPETNSAYGFLTWLNQHPSRPAGEMSGDAAEMRCDGTPAEVQRDARGSEGWGGGLGRGGRPKRMA